MLSTLMISARQHPDAWPPTVENRCEEFGSRAACTDADSKFKTLGSTTNGVNRCLTQGQYAYSAEFLSTFALVSSSGRQPPGQFKSSH